MKSNRGASIILNMDTKAADIMSTEVITAHEDMTLEDVLKLLINGRITGLPVVDAKGRMRGILSDMDILNQITKAKSLKPDAFQKPIMYSTKVLTVRENTPLPEILDKFQKTKYRRLPVVNAKGKLVGIITRRDLMRLFYYRARLL